MSWQSLYLASFVLGLTFVALAAAVGHFGAAGHDGHAAHAGHAAGDDSGLPLPLLSPTVLAVFVGMFGAGGLALLRGLGFESPWIHFPGALACSAGGGLSVAWSMMKLMRHTESNSLGSHASLVGREVEVILSIRAGQLGEIAFEGGGTRQTLVARAGDERAFEQGERVRVLAVADGVALVASSDGTSLHSENAAGVPVRVPRR